MELKEQQEYTFGSLPKGMQTEDYAQVVREMTPAEHGQHRRDLKRGALKLQAWSDRLPRY